jgi:hypothetical protein
LGNDGEVIPDWPATGQHFSVLLTFTDSPSTANGAEAKADFLDREAVADYLHKNASFLVMAGPKPIGEARITVGAVETTLVISLLRLLRSAVSVLAGGVWEEAAYEFADFEE